MNLSISDLLTRFPKGVRITATGNPVKCWFDRHPAAVFIIQPGDSIFIPDDMIAQEFNAIALDPAAPARIIPEYQS